MKIPTPEERAKALLRIERQTSREVAKCFSDLVDRVISRLGAFPEGSPLTPGENPAFARMLDNELTRFAGELEEANERGITRAWTLSDHYGDIDTRGYLRRTGATALLTSFSYSTPEAETARRAEAVRAFLDRRDRGGFTISGRVWRTAEQAMQHIETSLAEGLAEGRSAAELSRTIRQDLREPDRLFRRVRDKNGNLQLSKPAKAYHPGAGVYRSSYKNALRLTRTEINVSYAESDFERWQRLDFVVGYEVRLSNNHTCNGHPFTDICDELAGKYPKWFKFTKWHPQCRCVCLAIFDDDPGAGEVRDVPANFKQWVTDNQPRLDRSIKKGTAPYWVRDNFSKQGKLTGAGRKPATPRTAGGGSKPPKPPVTTTTAPTDPDEERLMRETKDIMRRAREVGDEVQGIAESIAGRYDANCTPINYKSEQSIIRKVLTTREKKPSFGVSDLKDTARTTIIAERERIESVVEDLAKEPAVKLFQRDMGISAVKRQTADRYMGYTGTIVNLKMPNGLLAEIQVNTPKMIYAKEPREIAEQLIGKEKWLEIRRETGLEGGLGHKMYEEIRVLKKGDPRRTILKRQSEEYYKHFQD